MFREYQKNEIIAAHRTPSVRGIFKRYGVGRSKDLVEVSYCRRLYYYREHEIFSWKSMSKNKLAPCKQCKIVCQHTVNCKYTTCGTCVKRVSGHHDGRCCLGAMLQYYQLKCTKCHSLVQAFARQRDLDGYIIRTLENECLRGLMKLSNSNPSKQEPALITKKYLNNQMNMINRIIGRVWFP